MRLSISFHYPVFIFFGCTLGSEISGLHGKYFFNFWGNHHTGFHSGWANLHSHQVYKCSLKIGFSWTIVFLIVMMSATIRCVRGNLTVVLLRTSLMLVTFSIVLYTCWPFGCLLWKKCLFNSCSYSFPNRGEEEYGKPWTQRVQCLKNVMIFSLKSKNSNIKTSKYVLH